MPGLTNSTHATVVPAYFEITPAPVPVGCEFLADKSPWNLGDNVAPEKGAVYEANSLWIPVELSFLWTKKHIKPAFCLRLCPSTNQHHRLSPLANQQ